MYDTTIFKSRPSLIEENPALLLWTLVLGAYVVFVMIAKYAWYITDQQIGISAGSGTEDWQRQVRDLQTQLTAERAKSAQLEADAKERQKLQSQMKRRLPQLEETVRDRQGAANAELVARLQRAEAELAGRKAPRS